MIELPSATLHRNCHFYWIWFHLFLTASNGAHREKKTEMKNETKLSRPTIWGIFRKETTKKVNKKKTVLNLGLQWKIIKRDYQRLIMHKSKEKSSKAILSKTELITRMCFYQ